jgi:hypothetical protein
LVAAEDAYCRHLETVLNTPTYMDDETLRLLKAEWRKRHAPPARALRQLRREQELDDRIERGEARAEWYTAARRARMFPDLYAHLETEEAGWWKWRQRAEELWEEKHIFEALQEALYGIYKFGPAQLEGRQLYTGENPVLNRGLLRNNLHTFHEQALRRLPTLNPPGRRQHDEGSKCQRPPGIAGLGGLPTPSPPHKAYRVSYQRLSYQLPARIDRKTGKAVWPATDLGQTQEDAGKYREVVDTRPYAALPGPDGRIEVHFRYRDPTAFQPVTPFLEDSRRAHIWGGERLVEACSGCRVPCGDCPIAAAVSDRLRFVLWSQEELTAMRSHCDVPDKDCPVVALFDTVPEYDPVVLFAAQFFDEEIQWLRRWPVRRCRAPLHPRVQQQFVLRHSPDTPPEVREYLVREGKGAEASPRCGRWLVGRHVNKVVCDRPECKDRIRYLSGSKWESYRRELLAKSGAVGAE